MKKILVSAINREDLHSEIWVKIDEDGRLTMEGYDYGETVQKCWGDSDYEYWVQIDKNHKDNLILELLGERFTDDSDFCKWLETKEIPYEFDNWV